MTLKSGNLLQKISIPNNDPISYEGKNIKTEVSKKTPNKVEEELFGSPSGPEYIANGFF